MKLKTSVVAIFIFCCTVMPKAQVWQVIDVADGVKPSLELSSTGDVHISFMLEAISGFVKHAIFNPSNLSFDISDVSSGYFYGPLDLAIDQLDRPHINYHDHDLTDQVHVYFDDNVWIATRIEDNGHDGWDNSIFIDKNNNPHTSSVDPSGFGGVGVEYAFYDGANWQVEAIGSGGIMYANTTSLALDSKGNPHISYYNDSTKDLVYAVKDSEGWGITAIDTDGDVGRFSSLVLDSLDNPHISYYQHLEGDSGIVKYTTYTDAQWEVTNIDTLYNVVIGFSGARNMTSLTFDGQMRPHISYCDEKFLKYALWNGSSWQKQILVDKTMSSTILGQLTSLKLDDQDKAHIAYNEVIQLSPLTGKIKYITNSNVTSLDRVEANSFHFELKQNFPNPFNPSTTIKYLLKSASPVTLTVYDILGKEVTKLINKRQPAGRHSVIFNPVNLAGGIYFYKLKAGSFEQTRKMLVLK